MLRFCPRLLFLSAFLIVSLSGLRAVAADQPDAEGTAFFEKKVRPVLVAECYACHSTEKGKKVRGGLALDSREGLRRGGDSGPVIVPGDPARSRLLTALHHRDKLAMPPKKRLEERIVADIAEWIRLGAPDPRDGDKMARTPADGGRGRSHWAYQPVRPLPPPTPKDATWARSDLDRHLLAALEAKGLRPVGDSDRRTLIRRVTFDLVGLPPTPDEVAAFVADPAPRAYEKVVERLLASPRFGEKWGRHWLDVARYAESTGKTVNFSYPHAWRYRDYVLAAFNADKPYDQFIKEQLAGDLLPADDPHVQAERLIATGFLAIGPKTLNERNGLQFELDLADEQIDVTTQAFLGITAACARCHDHKFDPISQKDYYALAGIFRSTETCYGTVRFINAQRPGALLPLPREANPVVAVNRLTEAERRRVADQVQGVRDAMKEMKDPIQRFFATGRIALLQARLDAHDADGNPKLLAMGVRDKPAGARFGTPRGRFAGPGGFTFGGTRTIADSPVYTRGEPDQPSPERVPRGTLPVLATTPLPIQPRSSGRLELAEWIASRDNPLTARVMVNRVWRQLFGRGLVPTADDFGMAGRPPSHPALLDALAAAFVEDGWSVKALIRRIVTSRAYRLASTFDRAAHEVDPDNVLIWRMRPRRLDAEALRDAVLAVSGQLVLTPPVGSAVARAGEGPVARPRLGGDQLAAAINDYRNPYRSVYLPIVRDNLPEALALFDAADPSLITADRPATTVPAQGLFLLNNPFVLRAAGAAADRLIEHASTDPLRIHAAYLRFFARPPAAGEVAAAEAFLAAYRRQLTREDVPPRRQDRETWAAFCQALFASAEFQVRR